MAQEAAVRPALAGDGPPAAGPRTGRSPAIRNLIFAYNIGWLIVLLTLAALYVLPPPGLKAFATDLTRLSANWGYIVTSTWFAVLGGVALSFRGVYEHPRASEWAGGGWNLWYLGRPLSGIIVGVMTYWLLKAVSATDNEPSYPALVVAAFTLGTQESKFFAFLAQVANLILTVPSDRQAGLRVQGVQPGQGPSGTPVLILGQGMQAGCTVTFGGRPLDRLVVDPDGTSAAGIVPPGLPTGPVDVVVTNPDATANAKNQGFRVTVAPAPQ